MQHPTLNHLKEELANSLSHGLGVLFSFVALVLLVPYAVKYGSSVHVVAAVIYGMSLLLLYSISTLYHSIQHTEVKAVLRLLDHIGIYILIAGTYTPFLLISIQGVLGWVCFGIVWALAIMGILYKALFKHRFEKLSLALYLGMGWMVVLIGKPFIESVPLFSIIFVAIGGLSYTVGAFFYTQKTRPYFHAIWHGFVLLGSITHFVAVMGLF